MPGGTVGKYGKAGKILAALGGVAPAMVDPEVLGARASTSGTRSVDQAEDQSDLAASEATAAAEAEQASLAAAEQTKKDEEAARAKAARDALREAQTGGYAANILAGRSGGFGGGASRRLYGS